jgi:hypothetical protein
VQFPGSVITFSGDRYRTQQENTVLDKVTVDQEEYYDLLPCGGVVVILYRESTRNSVYTVEECDFALYGPVQREAESV